MSQAGGEKGWGGSMYVAQANTEYKNQTISRMNFEESNGLGLASTRRESQRVPETVDAQHHGGEHPETSNGNHACIVI